VSVPPPPQVPSARLEKEKPLVEELPLNDVRERRESPRDEDEEDDIRSSRRRDDRDEDEDDSDRRRSRSDEPREKKPGARRDDKSKSHKNAPPIEVGKLENPFIDSSTLPIVEVDQSVFEFDWGDESAPDADSDRTSRTKAGDSNVREDRDRPREKRRGDSATRSKKDTPDTEYAWDDKTTPPDDYPSDSEIEKPKKKAAPAPIPADDASSPFSFGADGAEHKLRSKDRKGKSADEDDEPSRSSGRDERKKPTPKKAVGANDDADFLGLSNFDDPAPDDNASAKKKSVARPCFHLRQTGFWEDTRLFRVFVENDELLFIPAAKDKDIPDMQEAVQADSLAGFDKRIRRKVTDLNELAVDDLLDKDEDSFVWSAQKITEASIDPINPKIPAPKVPGGSRRSAVLEITHRSKGTVAFDFPSDSDVESALKLLPDALDDVLEIHVRFDKLSKRYVKQ
jgi:hypothetical protein